MNDTARTTIRPLTSIRGFAALWVYLHHSRNLYAGFGFLKAFVNAGFYGVDIFFILSGFIITHVHRDDFASWADIKSNLRRFLGLRFWRIYPLHLVTFLLCVILPVRTIYEPDNATAGDYIRTLLMVHSWVKFSDVFRWNVPSWSVSIEWLLYLCFPFMAWLVWRHAKGTLANVFILIAVACAWVAYLYAVDLEMPYLAWPGYSVPRGSLDFIMGVALNNLFREGFLKTLPWDALSIACVLGFVGVMWLKSLNIEVYDIVVLLLSGITIYALANIRSFGHMLFSNRAVVYLGTISYSIYMWHWYYMQATWQHRDVLFHEEAILSPGFAAKTVVLIGVGALSFHLIENPARKWGQRLAERRDVKK